MTVESVEEVRPIPGLEGYLSVTQDGRVCSHRRKSGWLKGEVGRTGYHRVGTTVNGKVVKILVHRAVKMAWDPVPGMEDLHVHHKDFNRLNNSLDNLQWSTPAENNKLSEEAGRHSITGELNPKSKLTSAMINEIRARYAAGDTISDLAENYSISWCSAWRVVTNRSWRQVA